MKSIELLAPAGGPAPFAAAVAAGADAIYCGFGSDFNARRSADNFDAQSFQVACRNAHLAGVRVYVTINIVIKQNEMPQALDLIRQASSLGADAFIIQDWGLFLAVRSIWPDVECHISTQANIHDARGVAFCRDLGAGRVTLSRELSLEEIEIISKENCDLEVFGHGAICFCYSGLCLLSSLLGDRSANRGLCTQPCRLEYELVDEDGRVFNKPGRIKPMCPADNCSYDLIDKMISAGVASLKVEGRMKQPDYVYSVISAYRNGIDGKNQALEDRQKLARAFNRGFTSAYLEGSSDDELMSYDKSNNRGEYVGEVISSQKLPSIKVGRGGKNGGRARMRELGQARTFLQLTKAVGKGDILEITPLSDPSLFLTGRVEQDAQAGQRICIITTRAMEPKSRVCLVRSQAALDRCEAAISQTYPSKRDVKVRIVSRLNQPFHLEITTLDNEFKQAIDGFVVEPARSRSISAQDLIDHVGRMGSTAFNPCEFEVELDEGCGMGFSQVHKVRALACERLEETIQKSFERDLCEVQGQDQLKQIAQDYTKDVVVAPGKIELCVMVPDLEMAQEARLAGADQIYARVETLAQGGFDDDVWVVGDEVSREIDHERLDPYIASAKRATVGCISQLVLAQNSHTHFEIAPTIPVHNALSCAFMEHMGAQAIWLSPELTLGEVCDLAKVAKVDLGIVISGNNRVMTSEHCILQVADKCIHDCENCALRAQDMYLQKPDGTRLPIKGDLQGRSRLYAPYTTDIIPYVEDLADAGIKKFMIDATFMDVPEMKTCISRFKVAIDAKKKGLVAPAPLPNSSAGHLFVGIE